MLVNNQNSLSSLPISSNQNQLLNKNININNLNKKNKKKREFCRDNYYI